MQSTFVLNIFFLKKSKYCRCLTFVKTRPLRTVLVGSTCGHRKTTQGRSLPPIDFHSDVAIRQKMCYNDGNKTRVRIYMRSVADVSQGACIYFELEIYLEQDDKYLISMKKELIFFLPFVQYRSKNFTWENNCT